MFGCLNGVVVLATEQDVVHFTTYIQPYLPAIIGFLLAFAIEVAMSWRERSARFCWWLPMAYITLGLTLLVWNSWSASTPMLVLVDQPDLVGTEFRFSVIVFGLLSIISVLWMTYLGVRQILRERAINNIMCVVVRIVMAPPILAILWYYVTITTSLFAGVEFRLFS
jgi:hypothetical protein